MGRREEEEEEGRRKEREREDEPVDVLDVFGLEWRFANEEGVPVW